MEVEMGQEIQRPVQLRSEFILAISAITLVDEAFVDVSLWMTTNNASQWCLGRTFYSRKA